ncbi:MAG: response regulator [Acidobacteria bacterium]|nr:response regulator [Acidobacteriota bacterium]
MAQSAKAEYLVTCHNCRAEFDAFESGWCSCLHKERTLTCPHCLSCFCQAPSAYKQKFWVGAPPELWNRKMEEHYAVDRFDNPPPESVARPLVLLVDDEKEIRAVAIRVIESLGYGLIVARNGEQGFELAKQYKPDLVLTDAMMPKLDGREMGRLIKGEPTTAQARVVVMTSLYKDSHYKYEALKKFQADEYLTKPLAIERLRDVLQKYLG